MASVTYEVRFDAETEGNWCSQCAGKQFATREEAEAAIAADETAKPDAYGNTCDPYVVMVEATREIFIRYDRANLNLGETATRHDVDRWLENLSSKISEEFSAPVRLVFGGVLGGPRSRLRRRGRERSPSGDLVRRRVD